MLQQYIVSRVLLYGSQTTPTQGYGVVVMVFVVVIAWELRPVPIPNLEAKTYSADGTALVGVWESKSPPQ